MWLTAFPLLAGWFAARRRSPAPAPPVADRPLSVELPSELPSAAPGAPFAASNDLAAQRLWRLAFGAPLQPPPLVRAHARVRQLICAVLEVDELDPSYFPRRPVLMPQLMQALDDPNTASDRLSRMIGHDPVLSADVLRLANSSLYRTSSSPIESIQRATVVCGVDALRGMLATAMMRPVFRASRTNFPRFPRMLWDRTERAARAAELYAAKIQPQDRFEAQLCVLLSALGPLVVYSAALDGYSRAPQLTPNPSLFVELIGTLAPQLSHRIARDWQTSPRLQASLPRTGEGTLAAALHAGELLGTLSSLESAMAITREQRLGMIEEAGLPQALIEEIWPRLTGPSQQ